MIRFIVVNNRAPRTPSYCALCDAKLLFGYVREIETELCYCSHACFIGHPALPQLALEYRSREGGGPGSKRNQVQSKAIWS